MTSQLSMSGGCWPTSTQELLLRACLLDGAPAVAAWKQWQDLTDVEHLDDGSSRLLPLLLRNLNRQGVPNAQLTRYQSMSRWVWARNQLLIGAAARVIELLEQEGIQTLVLKGGALATLYYPSLSARPMTDFDLLVPTAQAPRAFELLMRRGYQLQTWHERAAPHSQRQIAGLLSVFHGGTLRASSGQEFDLHGHVLWNSHADNADAAFWKNSLPLQIGGAHTRALCAEDALFHVCAHGARWNEVPPLRWIADAALILRASPNFDWNRVVLQSRRHHLVLPVRRALRYLHQLDAGVAIDAGALRQLQNIPTTRAERREWSALTRSPASRSVTLSLWLRARAYAQWNAHQSPRNRPLGFARYLQFFWGLDSPRQLPSYGWQRLREHWQKP